MFIHVYIGVYKGPITLEYNNWVNFSWSIFMNATFQIVRRVMLIRILNFRHRFIMFYYFNAYIQMLFYFHMELFFIISSLLVCIECLKYFLILLSHGERNILSSEMILYFINLCILCTLPTSTLQKAPTCTIGYVKINL